MMVIPAYLYGEEEIHDVSIVGELLAVAAIVMCLLFVLVDMGRCTGPGLSGHVAVLSTR